MSFIKTISIMYMSVFILLSCQKEQNTLSIDFSATSSVIDNESKAGAGSTIATNPNLTAFGLFASLADNTTDAGSNLFGMSSAERVYKDDTIWKYNDTKYWDYGRQYRFRAYHPYKDASVTDFTVNSSNADDITIEYASGASKQSDLLFAFASVEANENTVKNKVMMNFQHALCAIEFQIKFIATVSEEDQDYITSFYLRGLHPTATVHYTHSPGTLHDAVINWIVPEYYEEVDKLFYWTGRKSFTKNDSASIFDGDGVVFAIPQTIHDGLTKIFFTVESSGEELFEITLPSDTWHPGKKYVYTITLTGSHADIDLTIKDWEVVQSGASINL